MKTPCFSTRHIFQATWCLPHFQPPFRNTQYPFLFREPSSATEQNHTHTSPTSYPLLRDHKLSAISISTPSLPSPSSPLVFFQTSNSLNPDLLTAPPSLPDLSFFPFRIELRGRVRARERDGSRESDRGIELIWRNGNRRSTKKGKGKGDFDVPSFSDLFGWRTLSGRTRDVNTTFYLPVKRGKGF